MKLEYLEIISSDELNEIDKLLFENKLSSNDIWLNIKTKNII